MIDESLYVNLSSSKLVYFVTPALLSSLHVRKSSKDPMCPKKNTRYPALGSPCFFKNMLSRNQPNDSFGLCF